jgi:GTP 3',8-cyclase
LGGSSKRVGMREETVDEIKIGSSPKRFICEVHREIYDFMEAHVPDKYKVQEGLDLVAEAYWDGKRMSARLKELSPNWQAEGTWPDNEDYESDLARRAERLKILADIQCVNIETIDWCNRKCDWCPNKYRETSPDRLMPMEVYTRILRQLIDNNYKGDIHPFLNGEPLSDKRIFDIVKLTKELMPNNYLRIVSNGDYLNPEKAQFLFDLGLDSLHLNHYDGELSTLRKARDSHFDKMSHWGMKRLMPSFNNRGGKVNYIPAEKYIDPNQSCRFVLHKLSFNYKGDMTLCCADFDSEVVFGNVIEEPISTILSKKKYRDYRIAHEQNRGKDMPLCDRCNHI